MYLPRIIYILRVLNHFVRFWEWSSKIGHEWIYKVAVYFCFCYFHLFIFTLVCAFYQYNSHNLFSYFTTLKSSMILFPSHIYCIHLYVIWKVRASTILFIPFEQCQGIQIGELSSVVLLLLLSVIEKRVESKSISQLRMMQWV